MLVVNFTDAANDRAITKCLRESNFSDLTFDKVYLNGAAAPAFFADKQVAEKPANAEITYSASWILLKDSDGFSQTVTMLDAPTRVKNQQSRYYDSRRNPPVPRCAFWTRTAML